MVYSRCSLSISSGQIKLCMWPVFLPRAFCYCNAERITKTAIIIFAFPQPQPETYALNAKRDTRVALMPIPLLRRAPSQNTTDEWGIRAHTHRQGLEEKYGTWSLLSMVWLHVLDFIKVDSLIRHISVNIFTDRERSSLHILQFLKILLNVAVENFPFEFQGRGRGVKSISHE